MPSFRVFRHCEASIPGITGTAGQRPVRHSSRGILKRKFPIPAIIVNAEPGLPHRSKLLEPWELIGNRDKALASLDETNTTARPYSRPDPFVAVPEGAVTMRISPVAQQPVILRKRAISSSNSA
jgi:hypothetical protein